MLSHSRCSPCHFGRSLPFRPQRPAAFVTAFPAGTLSGHLPPLTGLRPTACTTAARKASSPSHSQPPPLPTADVSRGPVAPPRSCYFIAHCSGFCHCRRYSIAHCSRFCTGSIHSTAHCCVLCHCRRYSIAHCSRICTGRLHSIAHCSGFCTPSSQLTYL